MKVLKIHLPNNYHNKSNETWKRGENEFSSIFLYIYSEFSFFSSSFFFLKINIFSIFHYTHSNEYSLQSPFIFWSGFWFWWWLMTWWEVKVNIFSSLFMPSPSLCTLERSQDELYCFLAEWNSFVSTVSNHISLSANTSAPQRSKGNG